MAGASDQEDRTEAATPRRQQLARQEGRVPVSREVAALAGLAAGWLILIMTAPASLSRLVAALRVFLGQAHALDVSDGGGMALRHAGLWDAIKDKLVLGENVSQAAQFATSGNAQGGIIAYSLALSSNVSATGSFELIADDWHQPLRQRMALLKNAAPAAERFYTFVQQRAARTIMRKYGFVLPEGAS